MLSTLLIASCSWAAPGADRFIGDPVAAVDNYKDIPAEVRNDLKRRIASKSYDELVTIKRSDVGEGRYGKLYDMHFGSNKLCHSVDLSSWKPSAVERGMVFCEAGSCVIIPTVCGNVSRIVKLARQEKAIEARPQPLYIEPGAGLPLAAPSPTEEQIASIPVLSTVKPSSFENYSSFQQLARSSLLIAPFMSPPLTLPPSLPAHTPPIPEPTTWQLILAGAIVLAFIVKRRF